MGIYGDVNLQEQYILTMIKYWSIEEILSMITMLRQIEVEYIIDRRNKKHLDQIHKAINTMLDFLKWS